jgi:hypothetical protein
MAEAFQPRLRPAELPRATLVDLWQRTARAHEHLSHEWERAVSERYGLETAHAIALASWPLRRKNATAKQLFVDDLRFIVAATELQPDMLTVADRRQAQTPSELLDGRGWFRLLLVGAVASRLSRRLPSVKYRWEGRPGRVYALSRGKGIELGFVVLLKAWQASQGDYVLRMDIGAFERRVEQELDEATLGLLWNYAALAYMLTTDRWYTGVRKRFGTAAAQELEKDVWIERGAAEYDLRMGQEAMGVTGNDVEALLRSFQFAPGEVGILDVELDLQGPSHGTLTHHRCPALDRFEHFDEDRLKHCCDICLAAMPISGEMLNRKIECKPLKLPPRRDSNDIACKWEYRLSSEP